MRSLILLLTRIPLGPVDLEKAARRQYLLPAVGLLIGAITSMLGLVFFAFINPSIAAMATVASLYLVTGLIHLDGLSDFSDGMLANGTLERKIAAMKDSRVGTAGVFSITLILLLNYLSIRILLIRCGGDLPPGQSIPLYPLVSLLITGEISAKLGMNTCIACGRKMGDGMGAVFIEYSTPKKFLAALSLSTLLGFITLGFLFPLIYVGVIPALIIAFIANKEFKGVNGDVIGASNEVARTLTYIFYVTLL